MLVSIFIAALLQAQGPIVGNASFVEWDYVSGAEDEFRIYCGSSAGVAPGPSATATVPAGTLLWPISGLSGQQFCVVTAYDADANVESLPSGEVAFFVFPAPTGARVTVP